MESYLAYSFKTSNKESPSTFQFICISGSSTILANSFSFSLGEHSSTNEVFVSLQSRCWRQPQTSLATLISENIVIKFFCTTILQKLIAILDSKILRDSDIRPVFFGSIVSAFLQSVTIKVKNEDHKQSEHQGNFLTKVIFHCMYGTVLAKKYSIYYLHSMVKNH